LLVAVLAFSFAMIPLACLLPGEANRRGQLQRILLAVGLAFLFQSLDLAVKNLASRYWHAIPLIYLIDLLPLALGFGILLRGGIRLGFRRPAVPAFAAR
jgi:lipopolysaccharide export system permease protein